MKKITVDETLAVFAPPPEGRSAKDAPDPITSLAPRQCPTCDKEFDVELPIPVANPMKRFLLCDDCFLAEELASRRRCEKQNVRLNDLPTPPTSDDYWQE